MRRQQRPQGPAQRCWDVAARAAPVLVVVPHVGRVARAVVPSRQVSAECAGTRVSAFSPARRGGPVWNTRLPFLYVVARPIWWVHLHRAAGGQEKGRAK